MEEFGGGAVNDGSRQAGRQAHGDKDPSTKTFGEEQLSCAGQ